MNSFLKLGNVKFYFITIFEVLNTICNMPVITELHFSQLKVVEAKVILILKSMSERGGSEIERLLILMLSNSFNLDPMISIPHDLAVSIITVSHWAKAFDNRENEHFQKTQHWMRLMRKTRIICEIKFIFRNNCKVINTEIKSRPRSFSGQMKTSWKFD